MNDLYNIIPVNPPISTVEVTGEEVFAILEENLELYNWVNTHCCGNNVIRVTPSDPNSYFSPLLIWLIEVKITRRPGTVENEIMPPRKSFNLLEENELSKVPNLDVEIQFFTYFSRSLANRNYYTFQEEPCI